MNIRIVLVGAGSLSFGVSMFTDLYLSKVLRGSTIVLHDIDEKKLEIIKDLLIAENEKLENKFTLESTTDRKTAFKDADFIINSIEVGERFKLWRQDYEIPRKHGSTQVLGECGGPGGTFHAFRIIPPIVEIAKDAERICPDAFFINFSNPMARVCLAIQRSTQIRFCGLCHQVGLLQAIFPQLFNMSPKNIKIWGAGLNHFAFLLDLENKINGENLMEAFKSKIGDYIETHDDRFSFSTLTLEVYRRFGYFPYVGDNHLAEYLQFGEEFTKTQDMVDWIDRAENGNQGIYKRIMRFHERLKKGRYPKKGLLLRAPSGERAIPIMEAMIQDSNSYEVAVNIPNDGIIENLPQDLIIETSALVNKLGIHGVKVGKLPRNIAAILRIEASVQDVCVEAVLKKSKELAITALAIDPNVGSFKKAEAIFNEMYELQRDYLPRFK
ncbi:MAG: family 4 glycosyl hydrolase [Promethearchaeota archaeon]